MIGQIYLFGVIGDYPGMLGGNTISLLEVVSQLNKNKEATELVVHINSPGGICDLGYEINSLLRGQGKKITTIIEGMCASIATVIAMAGDIRLITEGSEFMIHNPWTETMGDADHLEQAAADIRAQEDKMIAFYHTATGLSKESLDALMKQETFLTAEKAVELGFLTGVIQKQKAVALLNKEDMSSSFKELSESIKKMSADILGALKTKEPVKSAAKALAVTGGDGVIYTVTPSDGVEDGLVEVGDIMTLPDGSMASGDFVMPDGSTVKAQEGKIVEIVPAATAQEAAPTQESALEKENAELKAELASLKEENESSKAIMNEIKEEQTKIMAALKNTGSSYKPPVAKAVFATTETIVEEKNAFAEAAERRKNKSK